MFPIVVIWCRLYVGMRRIFYIFPVVRRAAAQYAHQWDTSPQREALIWKGSINGY